MQDSIEDFLKITKNSKTDDEPQIRCVFLLLHE